MARTNKEKLYDVIKKPIITEKSMMATAQGKYTFEVEKLGTDTEIREKSGKDPAEWARERAAFLTLQEKEAEKDISIPFSPNKLIL